ncbi:ankyrin repeat-containing domain protein [Xylaria grammica]|nr:ankyrin repeat-containing domain protein [Xylaria grammica]
MAARNQYTIGWISAITTERIAAELMFDEPLKTPDDIPSSDYNSYVCGQIAGHYVVVAVLPLHQYGLANATAAAKDMLRSFPVRNVLLVGIAGGAPNLKNKVDIRLGDVVVSCPGGHGDSGVLQHDYGKKLQDDGDLTRFEITGHLNQSHVSMLNAMSSLTAAQKIRGHQIQAIIQNALNKDGIRAKLKRELKRPDVNTDKLFKSHVTHQEGLKTFSREVRAPEDDDPEIHFGLVASGNSLMKDAVMRDQLSQERGVLCFEMEAAALMNHIPCLVIRGICDYSDTHKNDAWQGYAAMTAAAYAKELLRKLNHNQVEAAEKLISKIDQGRSPLPPTNGDTTNPQSRGRDVRSEIKDLNARDSNTGLRDWLSPPDPSTNLNKALKKRHQGSGQWLLRCKVYSTWKATQSSILWLNGIPGCGKTILSSTIIEDLKSTKSSQPVLYFYFDFTVTKKQFFEDALRSLASQLFFQNEDTRECLRSLYSTCKDGQDQPSTHELANTLQSMIKRAGEIWIVLDALDECSKREESSDGGLSTWIKRCRDPEFNIHTLVTSRPEQHITSTLRKWIQKAEIIPLQSNLVSDDIRAYIQTKIRQLSRWDDQLDIREKVEADLIDKAGGMFLWVSCQFNTLEKCYLCTEAEDALKDLLQSLDDTYARIIRELPLGHRPYAKRLLQFLSFSDRPLRIEESVDAVAVRLGETPLFDPADRMPISEEITQYCPGLIVQVDIQTTEGKAVTEIQLAHFSVKEYLTSDRLTDDIAQDLRETAARTTIANVCLTYLINIKSDSLDEVLRNFPLARYSAQYWMSHAVATKESRQAAVAKIMQLFSFKGAYKLCCLLYDPDMPQAGPGDRPIPAPLYYASQGGHYECVRKLLSQGADVNEQGGRHANALRVASTKGHTEIVKLLLRYKADVDAENGHCNNALYVASSEGYTAIVKLLLEYKADVNAHDDHYGNALYVASAEGHIEIVQLLLNNRAKVNTYSNGRTALYEASLNGHLEVVRLLLEKGSRVNASSNGSNALSAASSKGHLEIARLLLERGAKINMRTANGRTALYEASLNGHLEVVRLPLKKGSLVNASSNSSNALSAASSEGYPKIVQLLLETGGNDNVQNGRINALREASSNGHLEVVRLLLNTEANLLLEKLAKVNPQSSAYGNALRAALLLNKGADANAEDRQSNMLCSASALEEASHNRHTEIVKALLKHSANINAQSSKYGNSLRAASYEGHIEAVKILLDHKPDIKAKTSYRGHIKIVNKQSGPYGNALQAAKAKGHTKIVKVLQNHRPNDNKL